MLMSLASTANGVELIGSATYELGEISFINPHCLNTNTYDTNRPTIIVYSPAIAPAGMNGYCR